MGSNTSHSKAAAGEMQVDARPTVVWRVWCTGQFGNGRMVGQGDKGYGTLTVETASGVDLSPTTCLGAVGRVEAGYCESDP